LRFFRRPVKDSASKICGFLDISVRAEKGLGSAAHLQTLADSVRRELLLPELSQRGQGDLLHTGTVSHGFGKIFRPPLTPVFL